MNPEARTQGEILFEEYLTLQGLPFEFEKEYPGRSKRPDYTIQWAGKLILLDVKDFDIPEHFSLGGGFFDPYPPIREKIDQARDKFKEYKDCCCALVLWSCGNPLVDLHTPDIVLGAMYGDSGFSFPVNIQTGQGDATQTRHAFLGRGKMIRPNWSKPQNTTVSALITLCTIQPHYEHLLERVEEKPNEEIEECDAELRAEIPDYNPELKVPRVIVWHNAFARLPFPSDLFCGVYDSHFGIVDSEQRVTYRGGLLPQRVEL